MTTDSFHIELPNPSISPAVMPETMQMALSHLPVMFFNSSIPSINMLLPRETINASTPQASRRRARFGQGHPPGDVLEGHQHRPEPGINRPERVARRMRNARVIRGRAKLARIFQRHLRRQADEINHPDHGKGNEQREPVNAAGTAAPPARARARAAAWAWRVAGRRFWPPGSRRLWHSRPAAVEV